MKNKLDAFLNLYQLLENAEEELGIENLTKKDKIILTEIIKLSKKNESVSLSYNVFKKNISQKQMKISRAQFFKSLQNLLRKKLILKIGLERSGTFKLVT